MAINSTMLLIGLLTGMVIGLVGVVGFLLGRRTGKDVSSTAGKPAANALNHVGDSALDGVAAVCNAQAGPGMEAEAQDANVQGARDAIFGTVAPDSGPTAPMDLGAINEGLAAAPDEGGVSSCDADETATAAELELATVAPRVAEPLNMGEFARELSSSQDPCARLKRFVRDTNKQQAEAQNGKAVEPDAISTYLARGLEEAGLLAPEAKSLGFRVVLPSRSHTIYLGTDVSKTNAQETARVIALEGALNRALFAWEGLVLNHAEAADAEVKPVEAEEGGVPSGDTVAFHDADAVASASQSVDAAANASQAVDPSTDNGAAGARRNGNDSEDSASPDEAQAGIGTASNYEAPVAPGYPTLEECYAFNQGLSSSICAQLGRTAIPRASMLDVVGEWGARQTFSAGLESLRLPLRLTAHYRMNLMGGDIAIETPFVPASCQPRSVYSAELERVIPASYQMREQMACDYALRCVILLAAHAFRSSRRLCHAYVAVMGSGKSRSCLISGDISREALREFDLSRPFDARELARKLNIRFNLENDRLTGVEQGFTLENERFCPASRYEVIDLSKRVLPRFEAELLGAEHVSDLAINEDAHRCAVAEDVASGLGTSVETNVRRILNITQADADQSVREAGRRCAAAMISGELPEDDPLAFTEQFVSGDELSRACNEAIELLRNGKDDEAIAGLTDVLAPIDSLDTYRDVDGVVWRCFSSYVGRTLYNRLKAREGERVRLVPDSYYSAQLLMSTALLRRGRANEAYGFARRAQDLNPFDSSGLVRVVRALEINGDLEQAAAQVRQGLELVYDPEAVGALYYRLAFLSWRLGNAELADACYQKTLATGTSWAVPAQVELFMLRAKTNDEGVAPEDVENVIAENGVPLAPTERILEVLVEAAQGATDAEVFPVAKSFATLLGALSHDDVMYGVAASIEREPDR